MVITFSSTFALGLYRIGFSFYIFLVCVFHVGCNVLLFETITLDGWIGCCEARYIHTTATHGVS
jgi:hypothetical protein